MATNSVFILSKCEKVVYYYSSPSKKNVTGGIYTTMLPEANSFSQALYTFDIGQNDLTAGYFANKTVEQIGTVDVPEIISQFKNAVTVSLSVLYSVPTNAFV